MVWNVNKRIQAIQGLKKEGLRDNMTNMELILNMLAEASTTEISKVENPDGFEESRDVAKRGEILLEMQERNLKK